MMSGSTNTSPSDTRVPALDGFRGLAILMVTFYRFAEVALTSEVVGNLPSKAILVGASGVDFFFVLSGFLITGILLDTRQSGGVYFSRFYFRRTLRIFPLYFATLFLLLIIFPHIFGSTKIIDGIRGQTIHLWLYTVNLNIAWLNDWAYGSLNHFWSLAIEEQFYLFWPVVVYCLSPKKLLRWCVGLLIILATCRVAFSVVGLGEVSEKSFTLFRLDGLLMGAMAALCVRKLVALDSLRWHFRTALSVLLLIYAATLIAGSNDYSVRYTVVSGVAATLLLSTLASRNNSLERRLLETRVLRSLGKVSYAMYVFQAPLIPLLSPYLTPESMAVRFSSPLLSGVLYVVLMFTLTYCLALVSWHCFEKWILQLKSKRD